MTKHYDRAGAWLKGQRTRELNNILHRRRDIKAKRMKPPHEGFPPEELTSTVCEPLEMQFSILGKHDSC